MAFIFRLPEVIYCARESIKQLCGEVIKLGAQNAFIITDTGIVNAGIADKVAKILESGGISFRLFTDVESEPGVKNVEMAAACFKEQAYDLIIGLGGGSSLDVAKGVSILAANGGKILDYVGVNLVPKPGIQMILIPTTAGTGAEVTQNTIFTDKDAKLKKGIISEYLLPKVVIVDADLTLTVPPKVTAATGMDALTHAIESYTAPKATAHTEIYALEAIKLISRNLRRAVAYGNDPEAREKMMLGSLFAGISLANAGVGGVHALAYPLGGQFEVSHGVANALLLPYVMEFNILGDLPKFNKVALAMGIKVEGMTEREGAFAALQAVKELSGDLSIPGHLREVGVTEDDVEGMACSAMSSTRLINNNPRLLTLQDVREIYRKAL